MDPLGTRKRQRFPLDALVLDDTSAEPLYRQLERQIREGILEGLLPPGTRLPSTRRLASDLGVARNTAINAYDQLIVEGYLVPVRGSGTKVALDLPERTLHAPSPSSPPAVAKEPFPITAAGKKIAAFTPWIETAAARSPRPFRPHTPSSDAFPRELWSRLTTRRIRRSSRMLLERVDPRGYRPLRETVAGYVTQTRGVRCSPAQVIITAGVQQAIELIAKLLIETGDTVFMEDPGYTPARILFELTGATVKGMPVDDQGLNVTSVEKAKTVAKLIYVTPSSQFPLGMAMSLQRRLALIEWAERTGSLILEDDYNGEYRYVGRPLPALHSLARRAQVLYTGSFSKLLFPSLRIGYVVVPQAMVDLFSSARWLIDRHSPPLEQAVLTDFIEEGHFVRHIRRMRTLYAERQAALVEATSEELDGILTAPALEAGLHLISYLNNGVSEEKFLAAARRADVDLSPVSLFSIAKPKTPSIMLGYAPFSPNEIRNATRALARECRKLPGGK